MMGAPMHKTFVIPCSPHADRMAEAIEQKANNLEQDGYDVASFTLVFWAQSRILCVSHGLYASG